MAPDGIITDVSGEPLPTSVEEETNVGENQNDMGTGETGTIRFPSQFHRASDGSDAQMHVLCAVDCGTNVK